MGHEIASDFSVRFPISHMGISAATFKAAESMVRKKASAMERGKEQAFCYHDEVMVAMNALRKPADELEKLVDKKYWPFPTYADLLFEV